MTTLIKYILALLTSLTVITFAQGQTSQEDPQTFSATVLDAKTQEPIPFATVQTAKNKGTITNTEGVFSVVLKEDRAQNDSIFISSMGYGKKGILPSMVVDGVVLLKAETNELDSVFLTNNPLEPEDVIERVKENIATNYPNSLTQKKIFFRQSLHNTMNKMDVDTKKSTIEELDKELIDSVVNLIPRKSDYYSESVATLSGNYNKQKLNVERAAKLYDKNKDVSADGLGKRLETIFKANVKPDSYLKIKSGLFGTKVELDEIETNEAPEGEEAAGGPVQVKVGEDPTTQDITSGVKDDINELYAALFFQENAKLDILDKSSRYKFDITGFVTIDDAVNYVITFEPKGSKDFAGTMYVNTEDYAVMRLEYANVKKLYGIKLLGISYRETINRGKCLFAKDENGGYSLRFMELEEGVQFGVDRPLKVIEKNKNVKGRRKQNELSLNIDMSTLAVTKAEFVVFDSSVIDEGTYSSAIESTDAVATYLPAYDSNFWKDYTIMEPNAAIRAFKVEE